jgi:hypothetical protein
MVRELIATQTQGSPMRYSIMLPHPDGLGHKDELHGHASHAWFQYVPTISRIWRAPNWRGEGGVPKTSRVVF